MTEEQEILQALRSDNPEALEAAIRQYGAYVTAVIERQLGRFVVHADVEELAADVFYTLWQWRDRLQTPHLRGWLGMTARNSARDLLRKQRLDTTEAEDWITVADDDAARLLEEKEQRAIVQQALDGLDAETREIFLRYYYYGQATAEIALEMRLTRTAVKSRLLRGRKKLKEILLQGGYTYED